MRLRDRAYETSVAFAASLVTVFWIYCALSVSVDVSATFARWIVGR